MKMIRLNKGNGKIRVVYSPSKKERTKLLSILGELAGAERLAAKALNVSEVCHGFIKDRSPVTCALPHRGMEVSVCVDLSGWFDSVTIPQIIDGLVLAGYEFSDARALANTVCYKSAPRQGLPTSPSAANLAAVKLDALVLGGLEEAFPEPNAFAYTRYADDLTVSLAKASPEAQAAVYAILERSVSEMGWKIASHKTEVKLSSGGRRVIVGVSVGDNVQATRSARRRLRAALHQRKVKAGKEKSKATFSAAGLMEWCSMKLPKACRPSRRLAGQTVSGSSDTSAPTAAPKPVRPSKPSTGSRRLLGG